MPVRRRENQSSSISVNLGKTRGVWIDSRTETETTGRGGSSVSVSLPLLFFDWANPGVPAGI